MNRSWFAGLFGIAALALVGRLVRGPQERPAPPPPPLAAASPSQPSVDSRWAPAESRGESDRTLADRLLGYWRGETIDGVTTSFRFDATGAFACSVGRDAPGRGYGVHGGATGEWRVERGQLHVRWINADSPASQALIGRTAQTAVRFDGVEWVRLSGVEGDPTERLYRRAH